MALKADVQKESKATKPLKAVETLESRLAPGVLISDGVLVSD